MKIVYVVKHTTIVIAKDRIEAVEQAIEKIYDQEENVVSIDVKELDYTKDQK